MKSLREYSLKTFCIVSEGFPADISEFQSESDEDATDIVPSIPQLSARRIYGNLCVLFV